MRAYTICKKSTYAVVPETTFLDTIDYVPRKSCVVFKLSMMYLYIHVSSHLSHHPSLDLFFQYIYLSVDVHVRKYVY